MGGQSTLPELAPAIRRTHLGLRISGWDLVPNPVAAGSQRPYRDAAVRFGSQMFARAAMDFHKAAYMY